MIMVLVLMIASQIRVMLHIFQLQSISGFTAAPFAVGDKVFVEGIVNILSEGDGFNSADNKYNFYDVIGYTNSNPAKLVFDASQFVTTNPALQLLLNSSLQ